MYEPSSCELSKMRMCYYPDLTGSFFHRVDTIESSKEPEPVPSTSGVSEIAACPLIPLLILQLYHLPPPLPPSVSNSCCLFTQCQPLYVSCCTVLLSFSRYCTVTLKTFCLKMKSVPPPVLPSSGKSTTIFFRTQEESLRTPLIPPFPSLFMYN